MKYLNIVIVLAITAFATHSNATTPEILNGIAENYSVITEEKKTKLRGESFSSRTELRLYCQNRPNLCQYAWYGPSPRYYVGFVSAGGYFYSRAY